ncbi:Purine catabolism regulatory protein-like family protein [Corynebacterium kalinowskii]|uniref:Purine catabolism regulatory protein-like family protein n=2 Tax=Corynebacterium kalinowskii TaxID=2675216 RepID=A0A6B8VEP7_9CORY|nr:Purine catabolism regulatory protein-like family protein [Corynebacterium kalinowskii]
MAKCRLSHSRVDIVSMRDWKVIAVSNFAATSVSPKPTENVGLSIDWLLKLPTLADAGARFIGEPRLIQRQIKWVHIVESFRSAQLLRGGELVLATGVGWGETNESLDEVVTAIWEAGATCLLLELGQHWTETPRAILRRCVELELPLITTQHEIHFVEITEAVHHELLHRAVEKSNAMNEVSRKFALLNQEQASVNQVIDQTAKFLKCPVVLEDPMHRIVSYSLGLEDKSLLDDWQVQLQTQTPEKSREIAGNVWFFIDIEARGVHWGRLLYCGKTQNPATGRFILRQAAVALTVERLSSTDSHGWSDVVEANILDALLAQDADPKKVLENRGLPVAGENYVVCRVSLASERKIETPVIREQLRKISAINRPLVAEVTSQKNEWLVVYVCRDGTNPAEFGKLVADRLAFSMSVAGKIVVVLDNVTSADLASFTREMWNIDAAITKMRLSRKIPGKGPQSIDVFGIERNQLDGLMLKLRNDVRVQEFCQSRIGQLIDADRENGTEYFTTLKAVLAEPSSRTVAAEQLHISRSALYNRIESIEKKLGISLSDPDSAFALSIATRVVQIIE